jgi:hypothetical protein
MTDISFFEYYFFTLVGYLLNYTVGHLLVSLFSAGADKSMYQELKKNIAGFVAILIVYACCKSHFHTVNTGWIVMLLILVYKKRVQFSAAAFRMNLLQLNLSGLLWQFFFVSVVFTHSFYLSKSFTGTSYFLPFANIYKDPYYYTCIINNLVKFGIENVSYDETSSIVFSNVTFYHYGELWFAAFFTELFNLRPLYVFSLVAFSIYTTFMLLAGVTLTELLFKKNNRYVLLFGPVLLIAGGISFFYPPFSFTDNTNVDIGLFTSPKYPVLTLFILMQLIYLYRRDYLLFLLSTLSIIVVYTGLILPVLMAAGIILLLLWINKQTGFKEIAEYAIITFVFLVSTLGLIILQNDQQAVLFTDKSLYSFSGSLSVSNAVVLLRHIATYSVKFLLSLLLPLLLLCGYRLLKKQHLLIHASKFMPASFIFILLLSAIISNGLFLNMTDSFQFRTNIYTTVSAIVVYLIIQYFISEGKRTAFVFAVLLTGLCLYQTQPFKRVPAAYDHSFVGKVLKEYDGSSVARFMNKGDVYMNIIAYFPMEYMLHHTDRFYPVSVNIFDVRRPADTYGKKTFDIILPLTSFYPFYTAQKSADSTLTTEAIELKYLNQFNFRYVVYEQESSLPAEIVSSIQSTYISNTDGMRFSVMK